MKLDGKTGAENHILQLHRDLLQFSERDARHRGACKTLPNHVEAFGADGESLGVVFETATPFDTPRLMHELVGWARDELSRQTMHPVIVIAVFHSWSYFSRFTPSRTATEVPKSVGSSSEVMF